ncbi:hypothetical protein CVU37_10610 [candidate division BRC1 bacterium HGW-BRC1-1]|jgi:modulator of FtsH protease|nr:MAG: hypothetical protein CVU37_10610 [candidate division BRC1 bacterium HGW-BRC1-1]
MKYVPGQNSDYDKQVGERYSDQYDPSVGAPVVAAASGAVRAAFLQKVYLTLSGGIAITMFTAFHLVSRFLAGDAEWMRSLITGKGAIWGVFILYIVMAMAAGAVSRIRTVNVIVYAAFTAVTGLMLAPMFLWAYVVAGNSFGIVWNALALTGLVFGGLTGYVLITRQNFSFLGGFLTVGIFVLLGFMVATFFFKADVFVTAVTVGGLLLFALFVLYDTSRIIHKLGPDEWVAGALSLFIDFINMFIRILSLLGRRN